MVTVRAGMMPSRRGASLHSSPIRRLVPLAEGAKRRGLHVHHLNIGQPDLAPPASVLEALRQAHSQSVAYAPSRGLPETVAAWRTYYRFHGIELEEDEILITSGGSESISLALMTTCDLGDDVLVPEPFYAPYKELAAFVGLRLLPVPMDGDAAFAPPSIEAMRERLTPKTRAILCCNPNNPTGTTYSPEELRALGEFAVEAGIFLIVDETYREIVFESPEPLSSLSLPGLEDHVVVIDSVSKRFNVCGFRVGGLVTRNRRVMDAAAGLAELRLSAPVVAQRAIIPALTSPEPYVSTVVARYRERRDAVVGAMKKIPGVRCHQPGGAFYVVAQLPFPDSEHFCAWLLRDFSLNGETVMLTPMEDFYATPGRGRDEVRIACVFDAATLTRAIGVVGAGVAAYPGQ
ncbi:pyridoxal phosphate-dependent aminotransferase [Nitrolancea hollandica]|uniref:Aminotransferase n=1 Tax=Nitrolancea hollandica Lb TaxID=1129897 RepID=I4ECS7_9BACT|nr:pyridoxal phosphate-dependent aminotransferase [Nitrolancea hollandica]CCF82489.1 putative Aspartate aminotransferase B [Nitrolancea hollandica Lb]